MSKNHRACGFVTFVPACFERVWGGQALRDSLGLHVGTDAPVGEAWLIADHPAHESVVATGPLKGETLHSLLTLDPEWLLGRLPKPARGGRFPLMLKLLDCHDVLSVQVHPDDALAECLGEDDGGKTEMWYFLDAVPGAEIICGLEGRPSHVAFVEAAKRGDLAALLHHEPVRPGDGVLVEARTVHALGAGVLAAEIQQTSDVTYRVYDWNRHGTDGKPRDLHLQKALECIDFERTFPGLISPRPTTQTESAGEALCVCPFFAVDRYHLNERPVTWETHGESFHLLLLAEGDATLSAGSDTNSFKRGEALLIPGAQESFTVGGSGVLLDYHVPSPSRIASGS